MAHYNDALDAANTLDKEIADAALNVSSEYHGLLALATRQAMGGLEYTLVKDSSGHFNTSDVKAFLHNIGGIGSGG